MWMKLPKELILLFIWFIFLWTMYFSSWWQFLWTMYFSSWWQTLVGAERFYMNFYPIISILAAFGVLFIHYLFSTIIKNQAIVKSITTIVIIAVLLIIAPKALIEKNTTDMYILETRIPEILEKDVPKDCVVIAGNPIILKATTGINTKRLVIFMEREDIQNMIFEKNDCVLFLEDAYCDQKSFPYDVEYKYCQKLKEDFSLTEIKTYTLDRSTSARISLYSISS